MGAHGLRAAVGRRTPPSVVLAADRIIHGDAEGFSPLRRRLRPSRPIIQVDRFSAAATVRDNLAFATAALSDHAVPYAVLDAPTMRRSVVMVTADNEPAARRALVVAKDQASEPPQLTDVSARVLRVARVVGHGATVLGGEQLGCDIEFWPLTTGAGVHPSGTALAPRANRWTSHLTPGQRQPVEAEVHGVQVTTYDGLARAHALDVNTPVDAVYTWVDGNDPQWLAAKEVALASAGQNRHPLSANASRFTSREELRYSLRSLEMYAGWVRHVYLVTNGQVPSWLRRDHPGLTVVEHADIFPADRSGLPTFNSHAIEARLHHIDGLAEQYLYLNDDVFFGRPVAPEQFFLGNGTPKFFLTDATIDLSPVAESDRPVDAAAKVSRDLIEKAFDRTVTAKFQHVAHPQSRATMTDLEARFPAELATTVRSTFRHPSDVSAAASLSHYFGFASGRAVPGRLAYLYCDIHERRAPIKLARLARSRDVDMFCLNDVGAETRIRHDAEQLVGHFLERYFPLPSSYETHRGGATADLNDG